VEKRCRWVCVEREDEMRQDCRGVSSRNRQEASRDRFPLAAGRLRCPDSGAGRGEESISFQSHLLLPSGPSTFHQIRIRPFSTVDILVRGNTFLPCGRENTRTPPLRPHGTA
jgi:hypothetical protein